ncbi:13337_t:CDS:2, partial [Racocetra fulgida]
MTAAFTPASRIYQGSVIIENKIYFLGGLNIANVGTSDLFYLDISSPFSTENLRWSNLAPIPVKSAFSPSCLGGSNNSTIFLFEHRNTDNVNSSTLVMFTFDIINQKWDAPHTLGSAPSSRQNMDAVVDKNDNSTIIIYGGGSNNFTKSPYPSLAALDTSVEPYKWSEIISNAGKGFDLATAPNNDVYILDTSSHTWVKSFDLSTISNPSNISDKLKLVIGLSSGLLALIIIAGIIGYICYRRRPNYIATPGTDTDNHNYIATPGTDNRER